MMSSSHSSFSGAETTFDPSFKLDMCESALSKDKFNVFRDGVDRDIEDAKKPGLSILTDFLCRVPATELDIYKFGVVECPRNLSVKKAKSYYLALAIRNTYEVFDHKRYQAFSEPVGVIRNMIWGRFRSSFKNWSNTHNTHLHEENHKKQLELQEILRNASIKRQQKVDQEISRLGGVDQYNKRMVSQRYAADHTERETNLRQEKSFQDWLASPEAKKWTEPIPDSSVVSFYGSSYYGTRSLTHMYVDSTADFRQVLRDLAANSHGKTIGVRCKMFWNSSEAYSYPASYIVSGSTVMPLTGGQVLSMGTNIDVVGIHNDLANNKVYIVTRNVATVHRSLPDLFAKNFRARNPSLNHTSQIRVLHNTKAISELSVYYDNNVYRFVPRIGSQYPNVKSIFTPKSIRDAKTKTDTRVAELQRKEAERIAEMKSRGKEKKEMSKEAQSSGQSSSGSGDSEKDRKLAELVNLLFTGVLSQDEFKMLKGRL